MNAYMRASASAALLLFVQAAHGQGFYASFGVGYGGEELTADISGVNHPTRCDRLLYANPLDAPTDAACTDSTVRRIFGGSFDLGDGLQGAVAVGHAWDWLRIEAEFMFRSHDDDAVPGIALDNPALAGKQSEWSDHSPPQYGLAGFDAEQLFVNAQYTIRNASNWTPFVGAGVGFTRFTGSYSGSYLRRTLAEGFVAAAGGDPAQPLEWHEGAAGSVSTLEVEVDDLAFGYQLLAGVDLAVSESAALFAMARWSAFTESSRSDQWKVVRSHAPVQADGVTPFRTEQTFDDIGGFGMTVGFRHTF